MSDTAHTIAEWRCENCGAVAAAFIPPRYESDRVAWERAESISLPHLPREIEPGRVRCLNGHESPVELPHPTAEQAAAFEGAFAAWLGDQAGVRSDAPEAR